MKVRSFFRSILTHTRLTFTTKDNLGKSATQAETEVLISLTSIPSRLDTLHLTIKSLLDQNTTFKKIILWLHQDLKTSLPSKLTELEGERFEIGYSETTEPHRKLIETLKQHPDLPIVTCDDDMMYPRDWLSRLLDSWHKTPGDIVAHRCRKIRYRDGEMMPYRTWHSEANGGSSSLTVALGWGGVLYPPGSLDERVYDREAYMRLCPRADDLWYKAMSTLRGTATRKSREPYPAPIPILSSQSISLGTQNIGEDQNRVQLQALIDEYQFDFEAETNESRPAP